MMGTEQHYTPAQVAEKWGLSVKTVQRLFQDQPGVLALSLPQIRNARKRKETLRIPESVLERVHQQRRVRSGLR